jgi:hypothetical protein
MVFATHMLCDLLAQKLTYSFVIVFCEPGLSVTLGIPRCISHARPYIKTPDMLVLLCVRDCHWRSYLCEVRAEDGKNIFFSIQCSLWGRICGWRNNWSSPVIGCKCTWYSESVTLLLSIEQCWSFKYQVFFWKFSTILTSEDNNKRSA